MAEPPSADRERLRGTFDDAADLYQRARPDYPIQIYDDVVEVARLAPGAHLLEVGPATGKATRPFAGRGYRITCVELGSALASAARRNLADFPKVDVVHTSFEDYDPSGVAFDLLYAATAWHWVDPASRYGKAWRLLRDGGHLAIWGAGHVLPEGGDPFFADIQEIYEEIGEGLPPGATSPRPGELTGHKEEIEASGLFEVLFVRQVDWEVVYDADRYLDLLDTFSGHISMQPWQRERLYGEIRRRLAARHDGRLRRHWGGVLEIARRIP